MKQKAKIALAVSLFIICLVISFILGVNLGFQDGYSLSSNISTPAEVFHDVHVLQYLRDGKTDKVINLMEIQLDTHVIEYKISNKLSFAFFFVPLSHIFNFNSQKNLSLFKQAIEYRKKYPPNSGNEEVKDTVNSHLGKIEEILKRNET